jgi:drug/metabolite transporter (DMT)-like permease
VTGRAAVVAALGAALLFGASTPFAKLVAGHVPALSLAGLLYMGSGLGLSVARVLRDRGFSATGLAPSEWPWLLAATITGGIVGPVLLVVGLARTTAADAALLLNLEPVCTALLAWIVFREATGPRVILGMALILAGAMLLSGFSVGTAAPGQMLRGNAAIALACLCWGLDNNLTRRVAHADALFIAAIKGLAAGSTNLVLAKLLSVPPLQASWVAAAMLIGLFGYGISLVLFVRALRGLGSARAGAYFATAPFLGAAFAIALLHDPVPISFWLSAALMGVGLWLHLTERHEHEHLHEPTTHTHEHQHDQHHRHTHAFPWTAQEPHTHEHQHLPLRHRHAHYPDLHHRHGH